ncbi:formate dehydrogenase subunit alpha [Alicyclobacillus acidoterrestris]|uniref:Formate dehydrogenase subunit alpha n=1 Tax=Alicyclobacillus acidoterrestris (strain ATCC 49025 / DSM 3922 / CIP 106132 / NCIMB 13137 / GD3B) TaxID=1356854 RepID=T0CYU9_ALIAG|nr:formate dehydrogenase subunit alpha [Alicyclobacillus acidoterrestris]EPZ42736.1 oxidoreductase [Alicyclobacillus acidoterrestris ATCC 49025]UNO50119.1 formate dehydrogenase subunit alpha [Alicyclobacillus acidoterrestris]
MASEFLHIQLDGNDVAVEPGTSVLEAILGTGQEHPHVCYHPALGPIETCDTCIAEVNGSLVRACSTQVSDGMVVRTKAVGARFARKEAMDRILKNHELYCTVCDNNNGNCTIHNTAMQMEIEHQSYPFQSKAYEKDMSNPFYRYDPDQCILCGRCVEACQNLQVSEVLSIDWDREIPRVIWDNDVPINESSCVSCGHCVTVCPCNALMEKSMLGEAGYLTGIEDQTLGKMIELTKKVEPGYSSIFAVSEVEAELREARIKKTKTVCTYCGVGCSFDVWTKDRKILKVEPNMEAPANQISTCVKGKFGWDFVNSNERIVEPLIRRGDAFYPATWDEALDYIAENLKRIKDENGPDAIAYISSSKTTNEENYLMQKLARSVMFTNNIDNCSRYCQAPATEALRRTMGLGGDTGSITDLSISDLVIIVGANPAEAHPVLSTRLRRAQKKHGQKLIVADLRKNIMAERADIFLRPRQGTDLVWLSGVTKYIIDQGRHDAEFIKNRVTGFEQYVASLEKYTLDYTSEVTGLSKEQLIATAEMIMNAKSVAVCWAMGVTQHLGGSDTSTAICNLLLVTGNAGRPGTGAYPLRGHNNVQGAGDFGCAPAFYPGYQASADKDVLAKYEQVWGTPLPTNPGLNNHQMVDAIHEGRLKAMYLIGEDMAVVDSNANYVQQAFEKLDFFIVQDVFFSKTASFANVILPASPSLEKEGTFTNTERRIQRLYQVLPPLGQSKPDWQIIQMVANRLGANWNYTSPKEIFEEACATTELFAGATYERLEGYKSLQWPVLPDGTDTPHLYLDEFALEGGKARLWPVDWTHPLTLPEEYDLELNNGRLLEHFHEGNLTARVPGINKKVPSSFVEVSPELARERGIVDGTLVRITSPYGRVKLRAVVTDRVHGKQIYIPQLSAKDDETVNMLTSSDHDTITFTPAYKEMRVKMEVLEFTGKSPVVKGNFRLGHPNPQPGVNVDKKWARQDYRPLVGERS